MEVHRDSPVDNRYPSNVTANRFKPLISYPNPNGRNSPVLENSERRSSTLVNLPPTSFPMRNGNQMKKPPADLDHLTKLLMKTMNSSNEPNFFGKTFHLMTSKDLIFSFQVCVQDVTMKLSVKKMD